MFASELQCEIQCKLQGGAGALRPVCPKKTLVTRSATRALPGRSGSTRTELCRNDVKRPTRTSWTSTIPQKVHRTPDTECQLRPPEGEHSACPHAEKSAEPQNARASPPTYACARVRRRCARDQKSATKIHSDTASSLRKYVPPRSLRNREHSVEGRRVPGVLLALAHHRPLLENSPKWRPLAVELPPSALAQPPKAARVVRRFLTDRPGPFKRSPRARAR